MTRTRQTKSSTSDEASAFECVFCTNGDKMQAKCNRRPAESVYLLENLHFLQFLLRIRCREVLSYVKDRY